jgi:hypothetical protein
MFFLGLGCEGRTRTVPGRWEADVDTAGDTVTVRTVAGSIWEDTATLAPEVTIGKLEGEEEYLLGDPRSIAVDEAGLIYVLDVHVPVVRVYAQDGLHLRDLGRQGDGPGEYRSPDGMAVLSDGRVLVRDPPNARITLFDSLGTHLGEWPLTGGFNTDDRYYVDHSDFSYATTILERGTDPWAWRFGVVRYSPQGDIVDTIPAPTWDFDRAQVTASGDGFRTVRTVPFSPIIAWTFSPRGYMVGGVSTDYRIDSFLPTGAVHRFERAFAPVLVKGAEADERRESITNNLRRRAGLWTWNGPPIPDEKPPFTEIFASWEGNIWVCLSTEGTPRMTIEEAADEEVRTGRRPFRFQESVAFDVFSPLGRYLGHVSPPESFRIEPEPIVRGDHVWAVTRDALDVPRVVRFRIVRGEAGPDRVF